MKINANKVRLLAAQQGMKLGELAEKAEISRQTISTTLGRGTCRAETAVNICKALNVKPEELIEMEAGA